MDKDGYEDLMVTLEDKDSRKKHLFLFKSEECSEEMTNKVKMKQSECRYFSLKPFEEASKGLREPNSFMTTFFDYGEFG